MQENISLKERTTLNVGGPARLLASCHTSEELLEALTFAQGRFTQDRDSPVFVLGGGSNLLVSDDGFDGLVVEIIDESLNFATDGDAVVVSAGAGLDWDHLVERVVGEGLGGLECLSGIPGRVGAAPIQNIGAYGQEVAETLSAVHVVDLASGTLRSFRAAECGFGYRWSHFKGDWRGRFIVTRVDFRLERQRTGTVRYRDLRRRFGMDEDGAAAPSLEEVRRAVIEIRRSKSMVIDPDDPNSHSAGSFFVNPVVMPGVAEDVRLRLGVSEMPTFPAGEKQVKLSAAWLIERCGFERGYRLGRAGISSRHSLALINTGGATAAEVVALARRVRQGVRQATDVVLRPEPVLLGFSVPVDILLA